MTLQRAPTVVESVAARELIRTECLPTLIPARYR